MGRLEVLTKKFKLTPGTKLVFFEGYAWIWDGKKTLSPVTGGKEAIKEHYHDIYTSDGKLRRGEKPSAWVSAVIWLQKPNPADVVEVK
jgi:hypothetical protein